MSVSELNQLASKASQIDSSIELTRREIIEITGITASNVRRWDTLDPCPPSTYTGSTSPRMYEARGLVQWCLYTSRHDFAAKIIDAVSHSN